MADSDKRKITLSPVPPDTDQVEGGNETDTEGNIEIPVSWVYQLKKPQLTRELAKFGLSTDGSVSEMRRRYVGFLRNGEESTGPSEAKTRPEPKTTASGTFPCSDRSEPIKVKDWRISFNGRKDAISFLERLEEITNSRNLHQNRLLTVMPELLEGEAALWFRNNRTRWTQWSEFSKSFKNFFYPVNYQEELEVEISRRMQKEGESANTYLTEMQTLIRRHGDLTETQGLNWLYRNLLPEYRLQIRKSDYSDAESLATAVRHHEKLRKELCKPTISTVANDRHHTSVTPRLRTPDTQRPTPRNLEIKGRPTQRPPTGTLSGAICWRCGETGHYRSNCRNPPKLFCSRCRREGVMSRDCSCQQSENQTGAWLR